MEKRRAAREIVTEKSFCERTCPPSSFFISPPSLKNFAVTKKKTRTATHHTRAQTAHTKFLRDTPPPHFCEIQRKEPHAHTETPRTKLFLDKCSRYIFFFAVPGRCLSFFFCGAQTGKTHHGKRHNATAYATKRTSTRTQPSHAHFSRTLFSRTLFSHTFLDHTFLAHTFRTRRGEGET